ncbi:MAG: hypothetical protein R3A45_04140 [Bdellovibrionota bacterium]
MFRWIAIVSIHLIAYLCSHGIFHIGHNNHDSRDVKTSCEICLALDHTPFSFQATAVNLSTQMRVVYWIGQYFDVLISTTPLLQTSRGPPQFFALI